MDPSLFWFTDNYLMIKQELERKRIEDRIRSFRFYTPEDCREEMDLGVSTKLKLFEDPWKIKKTLTSSDVNEHLCRLLLPAEGVDKHITAVWDGERVEQVEDMVGERVVVWDYDTGSEYELVFKRWRTSKSLVLVDNWVTWFVRRRELRDGDEIGLFWDASNSRFGFRVLARRVTGF
ncbi:B3 domain-containing protein At2g33720-like [Camellia sinensis]|uniref:B3 domain-containing protein At2g33720-like n=1 Tax=Camellia sinensis TaxID=4442 RepID=UPI0010368DE1|nr:B3 domain-containing protein At2g33720-like [Camellia sinensis]